MVEENIIEEINRRGYEKIFMVYRYFFWIYELIIGMILFWLNDYRRFIDNYLKYMLIMEKYIREYILYVL